VLLQKCGHPESVEAARGTGRSFRGSRAARGRGAGFAGGPDQQLSTWKITTALLRLGAGYMKESVARKTAARLRSKDSLAVYVSRIRLAQDQFEVVLSLDEVAHYQRDAPLQSVSRLHAGDEVTGTVLRVEDYGVLVDVDGYNRAGLLHIQRVADLYGGYIDKKQGLEEAGLEKVTRVKLQVAAAVDKKRVFLDFTDDVKEEAAAEQRELEEIKAQRQQEGLLVAIQASVSNIKTAVATTVKEEGSSMSEDDDDDRNEEHDDEEEYDEHDEERDIEDALGLGTY
jgi:predicted RNA-binding protein with RPS1 domain